VARVPRVKSPPFKQRLKVALEEAKAAGAEYLEMQTPDGATFKIRLKPEGESPDDNDFDRPPNPRPGNARV
jgi:hypothetical protein